jgi:uncharacterized protein (TIGR03435 family)
VGYSWQTRSAEIAPNKALGCADDAVEKELGLKLVKQKRSIQVIVVDHLAEKSVE